MSALRPVDYFQIASTVLFLFLGGAVLARTALMHIAEPTPYLVGAAFVLLSLHRGRFIIRALRQWRAPR